MLNLRAHTEDSHPKAEIQHNMKLKKAETTLAWLVPGEKSSPSLGMLHRTYMYNALVTHLLRELCFFGHNKG